MTSQSNALPFGQLLADRLRTLRADIVEAAAKRRVYRSTINEMNKLSDRDLADLGIARSGITAIAYEAAYGQK